MIFGKDHIGSHTYIHLHCQIHKLKVTLKKGIRQWEEQIKNYKEYLPYSPCVLGKNLGLLKLLCVEMKMKDILKTTIFQSQHVNLNKIDHMVEVAITKLTGLEETLLKELCVKSQNVQIEAKVGIASKRKQIEDNPNTKKGNTNAKGKCNYCGKKHLGVAFLKDKKDENMDNLTKRGKKEKQHINQVINSKMGSSTAVSDLKKKKPKTKPKWAK